MLRSDGLFRPSTLGHHHRDYVIATAVASAIYGMLMGSFSLRWQQCLYSAVKLPLFVAVATLVCLPQFFMMHTILGLRADFKDALGGVLAAQATLALVLAALAPMTLVVYASTSSYPLALYYQGIPFLFATLCGQVTLARHYRPLIARNPRHRSCRNLWLFLFVFVATQAAWVLRPFVGTTALPTTFFRQEAWSNA